MTFHRLALITTLVAFIAILLGAYTRLSNAGLGCPDWPGCYGQLLVPDSHDEVHVANQSYPERPLESSKAWKEMVHRYVAGTLGLLILGLFIWAIKDRKKEEQPVVLPVILLGMVIFQALLGMWTVTELLKPMVVTLHLLFGFTTFSLLFWLTISQMNFGESVKNLSTFRIPALLAVVILASQIALGGWTSSNYAALACPDLPVCHGEWWPHTDFKEAFILWRTEPMNYEGGILDGYARTAIHLSHRIGALVTFVYLLILSILLIINKADTRVKRVGMVILSITVIQVSLGVANVYFQLPLLNATAHNGVAALLLQSILFLNFLLFYRQADHRSEK